MFGDPIRCVDGISTIDWIPTEFRNSTGSSLLCRQALGWRNPFIGNGFPSRPVRHITVSLASLMHWNCVQHGPDPACVELHGALECQLDLFFDPGESEMQQFDSMDLRTCGLGRVVNDSPKKSKACNRYTLPRPALFATSLNRLSSQPPVWTKRHIFLELRLHYKRPGEHGSGMSNSETARRRRSSCGQASRMHSSKNGDTGNQKNPSRTIAGLFLGFSGKKPAVKSGRRDDTWNCLRARLGGKTVRGSPRQGQTCRFNIPPNTNRREWRI